MESIVEGRDKGREKGEKEKGPSQSNRGRALGILIESIIQNLFVHTFGLGKLGRVVGLFRAGSGGLA